MFLCYRDGDGAHGDGPSSKLGRGWSDLWCGGLGGGGSGARLVTSLRQSLTSRPTEEALLTPFATKAS